MTVLLVALAGVLAFNPVRAAAVLRGRARVRAEALTAATLTTVGVSIAAAATSRPVLDWLGVSGSSARIAAGVALVATGLRDLVVPATPEPALPGKWAGLVPLAFPTWLTPGSVLLAVAAGEDRGAVVAAGVLGGAALVAAVAAMAIPTRHASRGLGAVVGVGTVAAGALVTLNGVYAI